MSSTEILFGATNALRLQSIRNPGLLTVERVVLRAVADCNLMSFVIMNAHSDSAETVTDLNRSAFWFPNWEVSRGDYVRLYTKTGVHNTKELDSGTYHSFFWGRIKTLWTGDANAAVLHELAAWSFVKR